MKLDFQKTAEEGVWFRTGGEIRGKTKKNVLYESWYHRPGAKRGTVLLAKYCVGDQLEEADKYLQGFGEKAWEKGITQETYAYVEW